MGRTRFSPYQWSEKGYRQKRHYRAARFLDAKTVESIGLRSFLRSDVSDTFSGPILTIASGSILELLGILDTLFTKGSVVFSGTDGILSEDNANLFYDEATGRLGIGLTNPDEKITARGNIHASGTGATVKADGRIRWKDDLDFLGEFAHANTADRIYTMQNRAGTVAHLLNTRTETADYLMTTNDDVVLGDATTGTITITLPAVASMAGRTVVIKKIAPVAPANRVIVDGNGAETIDDALTATLLTRYESITLTSDGVEWWVL